MKRDTNQQAHAVLERVTVGGFDLPGVTRLDANVEMVDKVFRLIDAVEEIEAPNVIVSTVSSS